MATKSIRIFRQVDDSVPAPLDRDGEHVFITIGPGETRITILDDEGDCEASWAAVFGWSSLMDLPLVVDGKPLMLDEPGVLQLVLTGRARIYGRSVDTSEFVAVAEGRVRAAIEEIIHGTVGSGARYSAIVLAAPVWLHGLLASSVGLRPHILREISEV